MLRVILDFDGTLTAEERQAAALARLSINSLAQDILHVPTVELKEAYTRTKERLLAHPQDYTWQVNGLVASYSNEGAFILNTTTLQTMLLEDARYLSAVQSAFPHPEYDAVADCTNFLFHKHTPLLTPEFRPGALETLNRLQLEPAIEPVVLTNSLGDKVAHFLGQTQIDVQPRILGDTRQYDMDPNWRLPGQTINPVSFATGYPVDLRRPAYHAALLHESRNETQLMVVADTFSMPGALPLTMGIPFVLIRTEYTPEWCLQATSTHPLGFVIEELPEVYTIAANLVERSQHD